MDGDLKKTRFAGRGRPQRSAEMWSRDLCDSVRALSQPPNIQKGTLRNWQIEASELTQRFQFEWESFKRIHDSTMPLHLAERLAWLAYLTATLPVNSSITSGEWNEIRRVAAASLDIIEGLKS
jgi:hypothetical protein